MNLSAYLLAVGVTALSACSSPELDIVPEPVAKVTYTPVVTGDMAETVTGFGIIEFDPAGQSTLNAEIEARVLDIEAQPGEQVTQGQVVLRLGPSSVAGTELVRARRDANTATAAAERAKRLRSDGLASDAEVESAMNTAANQIALADSLEASAGSIQTLRSPIDGLVDALFVEPNDLVAPGTMMARLASLSATQARIGIESLDASRLATGDKVILTPMNGAIAPAVSAIRVVDARIDTVTRMATVLVSIPTSLGFHAGEAVRAEMIVATKMDVLIAARQSVFSDENGDYVFVAENDVALLRRVETGLTNKDQTEIVSGLRSDEMLIVEGAAILSDGMKIAAETPRAESKP